MGDWRISYAQRPIGGAGFADERKSRSVGHAGKWNPQRRSAWTSTGYRCGRSRRAVAVGPSRSRDVGETHARQCGFVTCARSGAGLSASRRAGSRDPGRQNEAVRRKTNNSNAFHCRLIAPHCKPIAPIADPLLFIILPHLILPRRVNGLHCRRIAKSLQIRAKNFFAGGILRTAEPCAPRRQKAVVSHEKHTRACRFPDICRQPASGALPAAHSSGHPRSAKRSHSGKCK